MKSFAELERQVCAAAKREGPKKLVLVGSQNPHGLEAVASTARQGLIKPVFVGDREQTKALCESIGFDTAGAELHEAATPQQAASLGVELVRTQRADLLMKGSLTSKEYLSAVVDKASGIRVAPLLSNVTVVEAPSLDKIILLTDCGMLLNPTLQEKKQMIGNAVEVAKGLGIQRPKVAVLCATEEVDAAMPATMDAAALTLMARRGQIKDAAVEGPLAFDLAFSPDAAQQKNVGGEVAGNADILVMPNIECGNAVAKCMRLFGNMRYGGYIAGAAAPVILMSRSASSELKQDSIMVALCMAYKQ